MPRYIQAARQVILQAGALAKDYHRKEGIAFSKKGPRDLVTEADKIVEKFIREQLTGEFPELGFWGEEGGISDNQENCWIVDPIDGTHSFYRGQYFWSISIALKIESELVFGAVFAPALDDLYLAEANKGAFRNGQPIKSSHVDKLEEAMVGTGFACLRDGLPNNNLDRFARVALKTRDQRRFGSAALDICMVADGQMDAFWEQELNMWDIAAGIVVAKEAGCLISDFKGNEGINTKEVLVSNAFIHDQILKLM